MNLDESQRKQVIQWIEQGLKLSDIQSRLASDLGVTMTYMDVRFLVDDLKLTPKDTEAKSAPATLQASATAATPQSRTAQTATTPAAQKSPTLSVSVDQAARPGAVVSGKVTFTDGNSADWYFDQTGRLGLVPQQPGYRPPPADLQQFQAALDSELSKMGF